MSNPSPSVNDQEQKPSSLEELRQKAIDFAWPEVAGRYTYESLPQNSKKHVDEFMQCVRSHMEAAIDPFGFVEPCEPECNPERHAYHQGQWDMAGRIKSYLEGDKTNAA